MDKKDTRKNTNELNEELYNKLAQNIKNKGGRKKTVTITLSENILDYITKMAEIRGVSKSRFIEDALILDKQILEYVLNTLL